MKIIFLCSGNTCRSPMAEALFGKMVKNIEISSTGFSTYPVRRHPTMPFGYAGGTALS